MKIFFKKPNNKNTLEKSQLDSAVRLFENTTIFKSLLRIVFLAVTVSLASGLYVFADQVLMQQILPQNQSYIDYIQETIGWSSTMFVGDPTYGTMKGVVDEITRLVNAGNSPITVLCTAISLASGLGSAILYSKALGTKKIYDINSIWKNSFYNCLSFSIITSIVLSACVFIIIPQEIHLGAADNYSEQQKAIIIALQQESIKLCTNYCLILTIFNIFNNFLIYYVSLLNSEGKNAIPTIVVLISNAINILTDWVLLKFSPSSSAYVSVYGSAIATVVSYILSNFMFTTYLLYKNKRNDTFMIFKNLSLKNYKVNWKIVLDILRIGTASFFRNASTAVFSIVQLSLYGLAIKGVSIYSIANQNATYFTSIMGAVTPIYNLFFSAMIGILRGARTVISYNHGRGLTENIRKAFWISTGMAFGYGAIFFIVSGPLFTSFGFGNGGLLNLFNVSIDSPKYWDTVKLLNINTAQLVIYAFLLSGMLYFQSVAKPVHALISSIMYGLILGLPMLFILWSISISTKNIWLYQCAPIIISSISGFLIFGYTVWYLYFRLPKTTCER
ncbi:conserved hypothetical protein [Malacoplasma penetrans HF-2]|uniref:MATE efflux family protein n=1 Tax=Malacoplasma penetrans (strain HF-2) TaxID=272633 RepID=Q8EUM1_MALP2|nr:MATE family efflux transporter [Malacoplasma penetrans]BAC44691.1 conserved hypothetical protein [Malacoplasma penetrans HF-2]